MKKIFILIISILAMTHLSHAQTQIVSISPFSQIEKVDNKWVFSNTISLNYGIIHAIDPIFYYGGGAGAGFNTNVSGNGTVTATMPLAFFFGAQITKMLPSVALGGGVDALNGNPILMVNLNFYTFLPSSPKARYKSLIKNKE